MARAGLTAGGDMLLFDLREPINALSHGAGMMLALPVTWVLWRRCHKLSDTMPAARDVLIAVSPNQGILHAGFWHHLDRLLRHQCRFHGVRLSGEPLYRLQRLDHVGIYLLIAGTYTPVAWALMRGSWTWGTLTTVWTIALLCPSESGMGG